MTNAAPAERPLRVLHCPLSVGGHAPQLARAEREIGLDSWAVSVEPHPFGYQTDEVLWTPEMPTMARQLARVRLLIRALTEFDVVHLNFGQTILPLAPPTDAPGARWGSGRAGAALRALARWTEFEDLTALRAIGKTVVVTFQGDDARQGDYCREHFPVTFATEVGDGYYLPSMDEAKRHRIRRFGELADQMFALNPDLLHVLPAGARFLPYANIDIRRWSPVPSDGTPAVPVVVHAPSHQGVKGTRFVVEAVERLRQEGVAFEFRLVQGLTHDQARREYERADLLVDQLLAGWYGGLGVEFMALGKAVVCYIREPDLAFVPAAMRAELPCIPASPDTIYEVLREWLTVRRGDLRVRGQRSRGFIERWHDPLAIAREMAGVYQASQRRSRAR